ncbi:hypothetical protein [Nocardiopsis sp. FR6]|uniref:hypothetical protein n=1 Tax=Nocardiopsis sp. FR6 TaxID=2605986 RepID=UPI003519E0BC
MFDESRTFVPGDTLAVVRVRGVDAALDACVGTDKGGGEPVPAGYDPDLARRVVRMADRAEYKRRQSAPGTKISPATSAATGARPSPAGGPSG